jgi:hypothetical protein
LPLPECLGIQVAPPEAVLVRRDYLFAIETLAEMGMKAERCGQSRWGGTDGSLKVKAGLR